MVVRSNSLEHAGSIPATSATSSTPPGCFTVSYSQVQPHQDRSTVHAAAARCPTLAVAGCSASSMPFPGSPGALPSSLTLDAPRHPTDVVLRPHRTDPVNHQLPVSRTYVDASWTVGVGEQARPRESIASRRRRTLLLRRHPDHACCRGRSVPVGFRLQRRRISRRHRLRAGFFAAPVAGMTILIAPPGGAVHRSSSRWWNWPVLAAPTSPAAVRRALIPLPQRPLIFDRPVVPDLPAQLPRTVPRGQVLERKYHQRK